MRIRLIIAKFCRCFLLASVYFVFNSCGVTKEFIVSNWFKNWERRTIKIDKINSDLSTEIQKLANIELCETNYMNFNLEKYTNVKYFVVQEIIEMKLYKNLPTMMDRYLGNIVIQEFLINYRPKCNNDLIPLILTPNKLKKINKKPNYGFGCVDYNTNINNAKVLLGKHYLNENYTNPKAISSIEINTKLDTALVSTNTTYDSYLKRYLNVNGKWLFDELIYHAVE